MINLIVAFFEKIKIVKETIKQIENWHIPIKLYLGISNKDDIVNFKNGTKCIVRNKSDAIAFLFTDAPEGATPEKFGLSSMG